MTELIPTVCFVGIMLSAAVYDLRSRRIPNQLAVGGLVLGLATRAALGWPALGAGLLAAALALCLGLGLFAIRAMGAGDGKLMGVVGAFMGLEGGLVALLASAMVGGVLSMALALRRGVILPILYSTRELGAWLLTFGRRGERVRLDGVGAVTFPFGVAIAIGSLLAWFGVIHL